MGQQLQQQDGFSLMSCFRLQSHRLRVETACFCEGTSNLCDKCGTGDVQDEKHILFHCSCRQACDLRVRYLDLFDRVQSSHGLAAVPFLPRSVYMENSAVMGFLGQDCVRLYKYISDM